MTQLPSPKSVQGSSTMQSLFQPDSVHLSHLILSFLPLWDRCRATRVSKAWHDADRAAMLHVTGFDMAHSAVCEGSMVDHIQRCYERSTGCFVVGNVTQINDWMEQHRSRSLMAIVSPAVDYDSLLSRPRVTRLLVRVLNLDAWNALRYPATSPLPDKLHVLFDELLLTEHRSLPFASHAHVKHLYIDDARDDRIRLSDFVNPLDRDLRVSLAVADPVMLDCHGIESLTLQCSAEAPVTLANVDSLLCLTVMKVHAQRHILTSCADSAEFLRLITLNIVQQSGSVSEADDEGEDDHYEQCVVEVPLLRRCMFLGVQADHRVSLILHGLPSLVGCDLSGAAVAQANRVFFEKWLQTFDPEDELGSYYVHLGRLLRTGALLPDGKIVAPGIAYLIGEDGISIGGAACRVDEAALERYTDMLIQWPPTLVVNEDGFEVSDQLHARAGSVACDFPFVGRCTVM
jgi:hypothetical protein